MNNIQLIKFGPLPIRILVGISLILHGLPKVSDIAGTEDFFAKIGLPPGFAVLIALLEVIGGFAILFGILTRISRRLGGFRNDWYRTLHVKLSKGFIGGYELDLLIMAICISLFITGPGRISIEYEVIKREDFPRGKKLVDRLTQVGK